MLPARAACDAAVSAERQTTMTRFQLIAIRLLLLALVLGAWEMLPRNGVVNPLLLPPLSDVLAMLANILGRAAGARGDRRSRRPK